MHFFLGIHINIDLHLLAGLVDFLVLHGDRHHAIGRQDVNRLSGKVGCFGDRLIDVLNFYRCTITNIFRQFLPELRDAVFETNRLPNQIAGAISNGQQHRLALWGNTIVAGCRLAGFRLLRNSYRPLESRTVVDFWNRYYYYYKELIADFFFYPVYMRCFKKHPRVRMLFATWVAVGLGVPLFHFGATSAWCETWGCGAQ